MTSKTLSKIDKGRVNDQLLRINFPPCMHGTFLHFQPIGFCLTPFHNQGGNKKIRGGGISCLISSFVLFFYVNDVTGKLNAHNFVPNY